MFKSDRYGKIERNCHFCICQTCGALRCPMLPSSTYTPLFKQREFRRCITCIQRDNVHIVQCESWRPKPLYRVKVIRQSKARATLVQRVTAMELMLRDLIARLEDEK